MEKIEEEIIFFTFVNLFKGDFSIAGTVERNSKKLHSTSDLKSLFVSHLYEIIEIYKKDYTYI